MYMSATHVPINVHCMSSKESLFWHNEYKNSVWLTNRSSSCFSGDTDKTSFLELNEWKIGAIVMGPAFVNKIKIQHPSRLTMYIDSLT